MILIRAAPGDHVHLAHVVAELGRVGARLHLEFLERIDRRLEQVGAVVRIGILDAVERVVVELQPLARDVQLKVAAVPAPARLRDRIRGAIRCRTGYQRRQLQVVASVERQFLNAPVLDDRADGGGLGFERRRGSLHFHRLGNGADLEREIQAGYLVHLQLEVGAHFRLETGHGNPRRIDARRQSRGAVNARGIGLQYALKVRTQVSDGDGCAGHNGVRGVGNRPRDFRRGRLRTDRDRKQEQA